MPLETNAISVQPVQKTTQTNGPDAVNRKQGQETPSGFRPQTNVSIRNAVQDMAGILSQIEASSDTMADKMPEEVQKVLENVMKQAFSLDETLGEGLGSTVESQRFSMEQLSSLARTLTQLSQLAEKGYDVKFSDSLEALLSGLKTSLVSEDGGNALEPVLILKNAFNLLNGSDIDTLPSKLQEALLLNSSQGEGTSLPFSGASTSLSLMNSLQKMIDYIMPRPQNFSSFAETQVPEEDKNTAAAGYPSEKNAFSSKTSAATVNNRNTMEVFSNRARPMQNNTMTGGALSNSSSERAAGNNEAPVLSQGKANVLSSEEHIGDSGTSLKSVQGNQMDSLSNKGNQTSLPSAIKENVTASRENVQRTVQQNEKQDSQPQMVKNNSVAEKQNLSQEINRSYENPTGWQKRETPMHPKMEGNGNAQAYGSERENVYQNQQMTTGGSLKEAMMQQPLKNIPEAMTAMKELAELLQRNLKGSEQTALALKQFVNQDIQMLSSKESRQLETLVRVVEQNIPATVQQAAVSQNLPDLPRLWAFMQLCDLAAVKKLSARQLKRAGKDVNTFAVSMRHSMEGSHAVEPQSRSINFLLPLFFGDTKEKYPTYIHVYDETTADRETGSPRKETWLRLCILTQNIGAVELTCRVYEQQHLDMHLFFSQQSVAKEFRDFVPEIRKELRNPRLHLEEFKIETVKG